MGDSRRHQLSYKISHLCIVRLHLVASSENFEFLFQFGSFLGLFGHLLSVSLQPLLQCLKTVLRTEERYMGHYTCTYQLYG